MLEKTFLNLSSCAVGLTAALYCVILLLYCITANYVASLACYVQLILLLMNLSNKYSAWAKASYYNINFYCHRLLVQLMPCNAPRVLCSREL